MATDLSLVIPAYNPGPDLGANLAMVSDYLAARGLRFEIVVVDDGSTDKAWQPQIEMYGGCGQAVVGERWRLVSLPVNQGKGAALRAGFEHAAGQYVIFTDADIPYGLADLDVVLYYLRKGFHVVIGDRTLPGSSYRAEMNPLRAPMSSIYRLLVRMVMIGGFADTQAGLKGFQGEVGKKLFRLSRCTRFAIDVEVLYIALKHCLDIKRVPVHLRSDQHSSVRVVKDSLGMIRDLVRIKVNFERGLYDDDELLKVGLEHLQRPYPE